MISEADLIDEYSLDTIRWARFDSTKTLRFRWGMKLTPASWSASWYDIRTSPTLLARIVFVMLNPSTANAFKGDPTVDRCCEFSRRWGADVCEVVNLHPFMTTYPTELKARGPELREADQLKNRGEILAACTGALKVVAAWGNDGEIDGRDQAVRDMLHNHNIVLHALRFTKHGHPNHPLSRGKNYIPYETPLEVWR